MRFFYPDVEAMPVPAGHRFPAGKYQLLRALIDAEAILPPAMLTASPAAGRSDLLRAHGAAYIDAVFEGILAPDIVRRIGLPWSPTLVRRSRATVGGAMAAARSALETGLSGQLAGGTHHAHRDFGSGFCVFNDLAVAALTLLEERRAERIAILDVDVHQGDGNAAILKDEPRVLVISLHGAKNFPFRKEASDLDIELPDGCADAEYLAALDAALEQVWARHVDGAPGLAFYLAGADPHEDDRLGRLKLTAAGLAERDRRVFTALRQRGIPVAVSMAGGYGRELTAMVALQRRTLEEACSSWHIWQAERAVEQSPA